MDTQALKLPRQYQMYVDRFVAACRADPRVVAAFLGGSYASGAADAYSDLDLSLITSEEAYEDFLAGRETFIRRLGEPVFLETFHRQNFLFFIFPDGTEGELGVGRPSDFTDMNRGAYRVLLDKTGILAGAVFPGYEPTQAEQIETLRCLIYWFWHDVSHFITAIGRRHLWWAQGQLEALRQYDVKLALLRQNFSREAEGYDKLDQALPLEQLSPLETTYCPLDLAAMLQASLVIVGFYQNLAQPLAQMHSIPYPDGLERIMGGRLQQLCKTHSVIFQLHPRPGA